MLGVCYYPEHWNPKNWQSDAENMIACGISWVRIGEFAWSRYEPSENAFNWDWLDTAIDILGGAGLHIVLGTPTATPPIWVCEKHPDMFAFDENGNKRGFGSRRHYCFSHAGYRDESRRITEILAKRYGKNPCIKAWQTDNEYGCHNTALSYSPHAKQAFCRWLQHKYKDIQTLNTAWGNVFWSMEYTTFSQIGLPNLTTTKANPSHILDFKRFSSDQIVSFNKQQVDILRRYTDADILHNYMGREMSFDHFAVGADLDIASWDSYPLGFLEQSPHMNTDEKQAFSKQGDPDFQAFHHDLYRQVGRGRLWIMEQQPGPVNWAPYNPTPLPGMVRLWTWEALAHGAEVVSYFRWRQSPYAQEQMHAGLLRTDGQKAPAYFEAQQVAQELKTLNINLDLKTAEVAIIFDYDAGFMWQALPQSVDFSYESIVYDMYRCYRRFGINIDILPPDADIKCYKMVCIPALGYIPPILQHNLSTYTGHVVMGPRSDCNTADLHIKTPQIVTVGDIQVTVERVATLRPNTNRPVQKSVQKLVQNPVQKPVQKNTSKDISYYAYQWSEDITTQNPAHIKYSYIDAKPAIIQGKTATYLGGRFSADILYDTLKPILQQLGISLYELPRGVGMRHTQSHTVILNYTQQPIVYDAMEIAPAEVVWRVL